MNVVVALVVVVVATGLAITAMLLARRSAPDGSYFHDGDRAAGVFGVLATGFAVLLGFVVFLAFDSYDAARSGAEDEARILAQQIETAQLFPPAVVDEMTSELICYARSVAGVQWQRMQAGTLGDRGTRGASSCSRPFSRSIRRRRANRRPTASTSTSGRTARMPATVGSMGPSASSPSRVVRAHLLVGGDLRLLLFFADSGERAIVQALLMGSVTSVIVSMLLLLTFLNNPFHEGIGGLRPSPWSGR